ncbi:MAG: hypothetical protein HN504_03720 [Candidatus Nitrosopelagicus sp.]|nr:hypothetical protein [Candidatus Nitrosopelagicus sp.]
MEKNLLGSIKRDKCGIDIMTTQVNSSFFRTGNKKHTTSFLRCRGVL